MIGRVIWLLRAFGPIVLGLAEYPVRRSVSLTAAEARVHARRAFADRRATWWVTTSPGESPVAAGRHGRLLLDGTADPPQVPPEGVGRFGCPPRQVFTEGCLLAQGLTRLDLTGLITLDLADMAGCGQEPP